MTALVGSWGGKGRAEYDDQSTFYSYKKSSSIKFLFILTYVQKGRKGLFICWCLHVGSETT